MSALDQALLINVIVLLAVLEADVGPHRKISWFRIARPLVLAGAIIPIYLKSLTTHGTGLYLELAGTAAGVLLGLTATGLMKVYRSPKTARPVSRADFGYAILWIAVIGARSAFFSDPCTGSARSSARGWPPTTSSPEPSPTPSSSWPWACFFPAPSVWPSAPARWPPPAPATAPRSIHDFEPQVQAAARDKPLCGLRPALGPAAVRHHRPGPPDTARPHHDKGTPEPDRGPVNAPRRPPTARPAPGLARPDRHPRVPTHSDLHDLTPETLARAELQHAARSDHVIAGVRRCTMVACL